MPLAELGAEVLRIDRPGSGYAAGMHLLNRGQRSVTVDLRNPEAVRQRQSSARKSSGNSWTDNVWSDAKTVRYSRSHSLHQHIRLL